MSLVWTDGGLVGRSVCDFELRSKNNELAIVDVQNVR